MKYWNADPKPEPRPKKKPQGLRSNNNRKTTGEGELFVQIWSERAHVCTNCGDPLGDEPQSIFFSHTIRKGKEERLRLDPNNIFLECFDCHHIWDNGTWAQRILFRTFPDKIRYIFKKSRERYFSIKGKIEEATGKVINQYGIIVE